MKAVDASKYTVTVTPEVIQGWRDAGCGLVIVQSHPASYGKQRSLEIMRACGAAGMPWDTYIYSYLGYEDWLPGALATLDEAAAEGLVPRKVWLDVEDVDSGKDWTWQQREAEIDAQLGSVQGWAQDHDCKGFGVYSAKWYWDAYMGAADFSTNELWAAQYDNVADATAFTPFGGWDSCRIKQFAGSQPDGTDLNVLSAEEEAEMGQSPEPLPGPDDPCEPLRLALERGVNRLQIELDRKTAAGKPASLRRSVIKEIGSELYQALG